MQRDADVEHFIRCFLTSSSRKVLLIAGGGFDPRAISVCELLATHLKGKLRALFLREERPNPDASLREKAEGNLTKMLALVSDSTVSPIDIFATDNAVIGGREAVKVVASSSRAGISDVIVDYSALSRGVTFPIIKFLLQDDDTINLHVLVTDEPATDEDIVPVAWEQASNIHGFRSILGSMSDLRPARLWLPQLVRGQNIALDLIFRMIQPHDVCPIVPFPASDPRLADGLIEGYATEMESGWKVDPRNVVYAHEKSPLDLYREVIRIDEARQIIFRDTGSQIVLSPIGSKLLSMGALLAALEKDFPIIYVEAAGYSVDLAKLEKRREPGPLVHLWLKGEAYVQQKTGT